MTKEKPLTRTYSDDEYIRDLKLMRENVAMFPFLNQPILLEFLDEHRKPLGMICRIPIDRDAGTEFQEREPARFVSKFFNHASTEDAIGNERGSDDAAGLFFRISNEGLREVFWSGFHEISARQRTDMPLRIALRADEGTEVHDGRMPIFRVPWHLFFVWNA